MRNVERQITSVRSNLQSLILGVVLIGVLTVIAVVLSGVFFGVDQSAIQELRNRNTTSVPGPSGATGAPGATNATGATGATGVLGPTGGTGFSGASGRTGASGVSGTSGRTGASGSSGTTGSEGAQGPEGPAGTGGGGYQTSVLGTMTPITETDGTTVEADLVGTVTSGRADMYALAMFPVNVLLTSVTFQGIIGRSWESGNLIATLHYDPAERAFATTEVIKAGDFTTYTVAGLTAFAKLVSFTNREIIVGQGVSFMARVQIENTKAEDLRLSIVVNAIEGPAGVFAPFLFNDTNTTV